MRMRPARGALCVCMLAAGLMASSPVYGQKQALTLSQIESLVQLHSPDSVVAGAIRTRGLSFTATPKVVVMLDKEGAGTETIAALQQRMPYGSLTIHAAPGVLVKVDEEEVGVANASGDLSWVKVFASKHHITASGDGWQTVERDISVIANHQNHVTLEMQWAGGWLTVTTDSPHSALSVVDARGGGGPTGDVGSMTDHRVKAGQYSVTATQPGLAFEAQSVTVGAGEHKQVQLKSGRDAAYWKAKVDAAQAKMDGGDIRGAAAIADEILASDPSSPDAEGILANIQLKQGQYDKFVAEAGKALADGGSLTLALVHQHTGWKKFLHPATITLTEKTISYDPHVSNCSTPAFTRPTSDVGAVSEGQFAGGWPILTVRVQIVDKGSKSTLMVFAVPGIGAGTDVNNAPRGAADMLLAYKALIEKLKGNGGQ